MDCKYFIKSGFFKRLLGIQGYCSLNKTNIRQHITTSYQPYVCCKSTKGQTFDNCEVDLRFTEKRPIVMNFR